MGQTDLRDFHERALIQPVLTFRLLPWWRRMARVPALYRKYRSLGLPAPDARRLARILLHSPRKLAKLNARWGQGARRRG